tara:strand:- start:41 stop:253 length:213 start_codon:yes stop_codon:yes gene_type:complete
MFNTDQIRLVLFDVDGVLTDGPSLLAPMERSASLLMRGMALRLRYFKSMKLWLASYLEKQAKHWTIESNS